MADRLEKNGLIYEEARKKIDGIYELEQYHRQKDGPGSWKEPFDTRKLYKVIDGKIYVRILDILSPVNMDENPKQSIKTMYKIKKKVASL